MNPLFATLENIHNREQSSFPTIHMASLSLDEAQSFVWLDRIHFTCTMNFCIQYLKFVLKKLVSLISIAHKIDFLHEATHINVTNIAKLVQIFFST